MTSPFGFLRARDQLSELNDLALRAVPSATAAAAMRALLEQIDFQCSSRQPVPEMIERVELAIRREIEGANVDAKPLAHAIAMLSMAIETARVGVEQGLPDDYWKRPFEFGAGGEELTPPTPEEIREATEAGQLVDLQAFRKGRA